MLKQKIVDALRGHNVTDEEMQGQTIAQLSERLSEIIKQKEEDAKPPKPKYAETIEITRSYTRKINLGNYESEDFFCSRKAEIVREEDLQAVSNYLAYQCKIDVEMQMQKKVEKAF
ncbi:unnamed protein product [marine sediment metagenome]|uniref:Uncharacterized protein n=1 Tax=marine sediment metagenome TaxID=412755 RepID=X0W8F4_9ZZZZ